MQGEDTVETSRMENQEEGDQNVRDSQVNEPENGNKNDLRGGNSSGDVRKRVGDSKRGKGCNAKRKKTSFGKYAVIAALTKPLTPLADDCIDNIQEMEGQFVEMITDATFLFEPEIGALGKLAPLMADAFGILPEENEEDLYEDEDDEMEEE